MCYEPEFELPSDFIKAALNLEKADQKHTEQVKLSIESKVIIEKIAEQTGLPERAITSALVSEGLTDFIHRGILF